MKDETRYPYVLPQKGIAGGIVCEPANCPLEGGAWYTAEHAGAGIKYIFSPGALTGAKFLTADFLLDGTQLVVFNLTLQEGDQANPYVFTFGLLNQCQARMRIPLSSVDQNRWLFEREGAWLKPLCGGARVDLTRVDRASLSVLRKGLEPVRFAMTPLRAEVAEVPKLTEPLLPKGKLLDELGQSTIHQWPGKTCSVDEATARLKSQRESATRMHFPESFSKWGGWTAKTFSATGFFRTQHDGKRWWLVDPDGCAFWSSGQDCVSPRIECAIAGLESALAWLPDAGSEYREAFTFRGSGGPLLSYLVTNLIRAFGPAKWRTAWGEIALGQMKHMGFNTVANWSDTKLAAQAQFPYVRPLHPTFPNTPAAFRDFPDVFHPSFSDDCRAFAQTLVETADDPALIGYFLMNEPTWGFSKLTPAEGLLLNTHGGAGRAELASFLMSRYANEIGALREAWEVPISPEDLSEGTFRYPLSPSARADLTEFSMLMAKKLFEELSDACKQVDPNHLNLGARYYTVPPGWVLEGMRGCFDVFSINCYRERVPAEQITTLSRALERPVMIGEWHFGALDAGLPASGIGHVRTQADRGRAYRVYLEHAAALPACIGVHYFTLYDQSALGRFDGENYQIGFLDVCHRPYQEMAAAAREAHTRMYRVAIGEVPPFNDAPEHLPLLFI